MNSLFNSGSDGKRRVLVVDDEPHVLKLLSLYLTRAGFDVIMSSNGEDAFQKMLEVPVDGVITDSIMPQMSGVEFVSKIRARPEFRALPILMLTMKNQPQDVKAAIGVGVSDYLLKPVDETLLIDKVQTLIVRTSQTRQVYELPLLPPDSLCTVGASATIYSISEAGLVIHSPIAFHDQVDFQLATKIFDSIGINKPILKLIRCEPIEQNGQKFRVTFSFAGVVDRDLKKIRSWIQAQAIQRRK